MHTTEAPQGWSEAREAEIEAGTLELKKDEIFVDVLHQQAKPWRAMDELQRQRVRYLVRRERERHAGARRQRRHAS